MAITNESKEQLKSSVDIVDVISDHLELKKSGANFKANCPFHGESTPSFVVSPSKQIYHCFGCSVGGDVFKFVQEFNKVSFVEAMEDVAARHNFTLQYEGGGGERKDYSRVLDAISNYYVKSLRDSDREYLRSRGLTAKTIKEWGIGYASRSPEQKKAISAMLLPMDDLVELGILRTGEKGQYAHFTDRVMFSICNHLGKVVGFSGRSLRPDAKAKYVNSMESKIFNKSMILFGFDKAKENIYKKKFVVVMEGQLDVILSHQIGIGTAVATQGTALTESHLPQLRKSAAKVILAYDGDKAGRAAAFKASMLLSTNGFDGGVVLFPDGMDPASMIAEGGEDEVKRLVSSWTGFVQFVLKSICAGFNLTDPYAKDAALKESVKYLNSLGNDLIAQEYIGYLSYILEIDRQHIQLSAASTAFPIITTQGKSTAEELLLYSMYLHTSLVDVAVNICDDEAFSDRVRYKALLKNKQDEEMFASILLKDNMTVLTAGQFGSALKAKQKKYLVSLKATLQNSGAGIDEILKINERMRGL